MMHSQGRLIRAFACDQGVRVLAAVAEPVAQEVCTRHKLVGGAAQVAAEGVVSTALLGAHIKGHERLLVQVQAERPRFAFMAEVDAEGGLRARVTPSHLRYAGSIQGHLLAIKWAQGRELYRGVAAIEAVDFQGALNTYLRDSQQSQASVRLGARLSAEGKVELAAGVIIEQIPDRITPEAFAQLVAGLRDVDLGELMTQFAFGKLLGSDIEVLDSRVLEHRCTCSIQRVEATLATLGAEDLRALQSEQGEGEITCHYCQERYVVPGARLLSLADELDAPA